MRSAATTSAKKVIAYNTFFLYDVVGIFQSQEDIQSSPAQPFNPKPGDLKYRDVNGDKVIDSKDRTYADGAYPDFTYSLNLNGAWKNFDLSAFFYGVEGQKFYVTGWGIEPSAQLYPAY